MKRPYPVPLHLRPQADKEIEKMEAMGIIRRSRSEYCSPSRIVLKKNGDVRVCLDARYLNKIVVANNETPQQLEQLLQKASGTKYLSTTDLVKGYWQIKLSEESRKLTAFLYNGRLYEYNTLAFGVKDSGPAFIQALDQALGPEVTEFVNTYVDDLLIMSQTFEEHVEHLNRLFERLIECGLTLSLEKSQFFRESVPFLGVLLTREGVLPDPSKLQVIQDFPVPRTKQQLQSFLGVCGYYRRFSLRHATFVDPFRDLLSNDTLWDWTDKHDSAFVQLKQNFLNCVSLTHYLPNVRLKLQTDASDIGISGILYQEDAEGNPRIVSLVSRVLTKYERNYTVTEKELLAIIYSVLKFRYYLVGTSFDIITDHKSLTFLLTSPFNSARLMRWILCLQEYNFDVHHCKGADNIIADFFSRNLPGERVENNSNHLIWSCVKNMPAEGTHSKEMVNVNLIAKLSMQPQLLNELKRVRELQQADSVIVNMCAKPTKNFEILKDNDICYIKLNRNNNWKLFLPMALVLTVISSAHEQLGHAGAYKLYEYLSRFFFWRGIRRDVKNYTKSCDLCQRVKYLNYKMEGSYQFLKATAPNEMLSIDFFGPLPRSVAGVQYLFVLQDVFSKLITLYPIKRATTQICLNKLTSHYFEKIGKPNKILSDHGTQFTSPKWKARLEGLGVTVLFSSIRHPQSNLVERQMREVGRILRTYCSGRHTNWAKYVTFVQDCINFTTHQSTGFTPHYLHYNELPTEKIFDMFPKLRDVPLARDIQLQRANENLQKAFDARCKSQKTSSRVILKVGDLVLLRVPHLSDASQKLIGKFFHVYEGPYRISRIIGSKAYQLVMPDDENRCKGTYNRYNLRKYYQSLNQDDLRANGN